MKKIVYLFVLFFYVFNANGQSNIDLKFNFATAGTNTPTGFIEDIGQPYGAKSNGETYGWLLASDNTPTDATAEARNRAPNPDFDPIRETLVHMNRGNRPQLKWEVAVPNGTYQVTVQAGDVDAEGNSSTNHVVKAEGIALISHPISSGQFGTRTAARNITVNDGRLTLDGTAGVNTKINSIAIQSLDVLRFPAVVGAIPLDGTSNVDLNTSISANFLFLPNVSAGGATSLNNNTINTNTVKLFKINGNTATPVTVTVNGTGGGDAINISVPGSALDANSRYRYSINGVQDLAGATVFPYTAEFTTGTATNSGNGNLDNVSFTKAGNVADGIYTSLTMGPDGKLYGLQSTGNIDRWNINDNGTLSGKQTLDGLTNAYGGNRLAIGLTFAPNATANNLIAYVSHSSFVFNSGPEWDGKLSRLSGANLQNEQLILTNLPRSIRDHLTNSIAFDPNNNNVLYFNQGSNTAGGEPDGAWGFRAERLLSAATLRLDLSKLPNNLPLNVQTSENQSVINSASANSPTMSDGTYNPYFSNAPLTIYASGVRNAYDLVWHSNGQLYIPTNGTGGGSNSPASVNGTRRPDGSTYNGPTIPGITNNSTQRDFLFRINPNNTGGYYGNPNPKRGEYVLNRGRTDEANYPNGTQADANYRGFAYDFEFNKSPNGVIEYKSAGALQGALIVCRYSGGSDLIALVPDGPNGDIGTNKIGIPGFTGFSKPLDLIEDTNTGNIYVSDFDTKKIILLRTDNSSNGNGILSFNPDELIFEGIINQSTPNKTVTITNSGNGAVTINSLAISGGNTARFSIAGGGNTPITLNQGQSANVQINYNTGNNAGDFSSNLVVGVSGGNNVNYGLYGLSKSGSGGNDEPPLQWVVNTLGYNINVGGNILNLPTSPAAIGEEVLVDVFEKAGNGPVTVTPVARYSPTEPAKFGFYTANNANAKTEIMTFTNTFANSRTLFPTISSGSNSFDTSGQFGFYFNRNNNQDFHSQDNLNTNTGVVHAVRTYPLKDRNGTLIPNAYLLTVEEATNGDYNDYVFEITNIKPAGSTPPPTPNGISIAFATPENGDVLVAGDDLGVIVSASDNNGTISNVQLFIDNTLVRQENGAPYEWGANNPGQADTPLKNLAAGTYALKAIATDNDTNTRESSITITVIDPPSNGEGLSATYYNNMDFTGNTITRIDPVIDFNWGTGSPDAAIGNDTYSVRWEGFVEAPTSGTYTFFTNTDDGTRLWVNNQQIINQWVNQAPKEVQGTIQLTAGQKVPIKMEYFENGGGAVAQLRWQGPNVSKQIIPSNNLFPTSGDDECNIVNLALGKSVSQSSNYNGTLTASKANDNNNDSFSHTQNDTNAWWEIDLGAVYDISKIKLVNRKDCCQDRLSDFYVLVSDVPFNSKNLSNTLNQSGVSDYYKDGAVGASKKFDINRTGRYVRIQLEGTNYLQLAEVKVNGCANPIPKLDQEPTIANLIYPNPTSDKLFLDLDSYYLDKNLDYAITNVQGQLVDMGTFGSIYRDQVELDVSSPKFPTGTYFLWLTTGDTRQVIKFIVMK